MNGKFVFVGISSTHNIQLNTHANTQSKDMKIMLCLKSSWNMCCTF